MLDQDRRQYVSDPSLQKISKVKRLGAGIDSTREMGSEWIEARETCLLLVPSAITKVDFNCVINPAHPDFTKIKIGAPSPFDFDERL